MRGRWIRLRRPVEPRGEARCCYAHSRGRPSCIERARERRDGHGCTLVEHGARQERCGSIQFSCAPERTSACPQECRPLFTLIGPGRRDDRYNSIGTTDTPVPAWEKLVPVGATIKYSCRTDSAVNYALRREPMSSRFHRCSPDSRK